MSAYIWWHFVPKAIQEQTECSPDIPQVIRRNPRKHVQSDLICTYTPLQPEFR